MTGLAGYLEKDAAVVETSRKEWEPEYTALSRLLDIFRRMSQLVVVKDKNLNLAIAGISCRTQSIIRSGLRTTPKKDNRRARFDETRS